MLDAMLKYLKLKITVENTRIRLDSIIACERIMNSVVLQ